MLSKCICFFGHLLSDFIFQERSTFSLIWGRISWFSKIMDHDSDLLDAAGIMMDFFKQPQASVQIEATWSFSNFLWFFWSIRQILFTSVPLYYFDVKSDWLPVFPVAFGSPPEDLLFWYLLFVPIEYHGFSNFSRWNVSQMRTIVFVQSTDFPRPEPICRWLVIFGVIWYSCWGGFSGPFLYMEPFRNMILGQSADFCW